VQALFVEQSSLLVVVLAVACNIHHQEVREFVVQDLPFAWEFCFVARHSITRNGFFHSLNNTSFKRHVSLTNSWYAHALTIT
jgi:hypothetical protein